MIGPPPGGWPLWGGSYGGWPAWGPPGRWPTWRTSSWGLPADGRDHGAPGWRPPPGDYRPGDQLPWESVRRRQSRRDVPPCGSGPGGSGPGGSGAGRGGIGRRGAGHTGAWHSGAWNSAAEPGAWPRGYRRGRRGRGYDQQPADPARYVSRLLAWQSAAWLVLACIGLGVWLSTLPSGLALGSASAVALWKCSELLAIAFGAGLGSAQGSMACRLRGGRGAIRAAAAGLRALTVASGLVAGAIAVLLVGSVMELIVLNGTLPVVRSCMVLASGVVAVVLSRFVLLNGQGAAPRPNVAGWGAVTGDAGTASSLARRDR